MADISLTISSIQSRIIDLEEEMNIQNTKLAIHLQEAQEDINGINVQLKAQEREDAEIHQEMHVVSEAVNSNKNRISDIEVQDKEQNARLGQHDTDISNLEHSMRDMDNEHHEELHLLANRIDSNDSRIEDLRNYKALVPEHEFLSEQDYIDLGAKVKEKILYLTYEE